MSSGPFRGRLAARGFALSVLVAWPGLASAPGALAERAAAIDRPVAIAEVKPEPIVFGRAVVTPKAGARVWRIGSADRPSGLWLDGGGTLSLKTDAQGKVFSTALLRLVLDVPDAEARALGLPGALREQ